MSSSCRALRRRICLAPCHDMYQRIGPVYHRDMPPPRFYYFRVRFTDCRRDDDDFGILQIFRLLADADARALFGKFIRNSRPLEVRPRYDISFFYKNIGYCPHACAGNTDKMYLSYVVEIDHGLTHPSLRRFPCVGAQSITPASQYREQPEADPEPAGLAMDAKASGSSFK